MNQFSVINNPNISNLKTVPASREVESGQALKLLAGRQFHVCGENVFDALPHVDRLAGGVFITGEQAVKRMNNLRSQHQTVPLIAEPDAIRKFHATGKTPFQLRDANLFHDSTLEGALDAQRADGSDLAMTPTGQIRKGDSAALKAALRVANELDRTDTLLTLPLVAGWLSDEQLRRQVVKVIDRSRHPVALTFVDKKNPLESRKRMHAYRQILRETTGTVLAYRIDLFGFDALAQGAIASAIGAIPSARRLNPIGAGGSSSDPEDRSPHMLIGDILHFSRSKYMRRRWFAEAPPFRCFCLVCRGAEIDRLHGDEADRTAGHQHNVLEIGRLHSTTIGLSLPELQASWKLQVRGSLDVYAQLESHIGRDVKIPNDLLFWSAPEPTR